MLAGVGVAFVVVPLFTRYCVRSRGSVCPETLTSSEIAKQLSNILEREHIENIKLYLSALTKVSKYF